MEVRVQTGCCTSHASIMAGGPPTPMILSTPPPSTRRTRRASSAGSTTKGRTSPTLRPHRPTSHRPGFLRTARTRTQTRGRSTRRLPTRRRPTWVHLTLNFSKFVFQHRLDRFTCNKNKDMNDMMALLKGYTVPAHWQTLINLFLLFLPSVSK